MTVLDDREVLRERPTDAVVRRPVQVRRARTAPGGPAVAPLSYRGNGVRLSRVPHTRQTVSTSTSIGLACVAALITLGLGALADLSGGGRPADPEPVSGQLAVVQVQAGETLQDVAGRVAPGSPIGQVVERIRELNKLESASVDVGQTLIAPIS